MAEEIDDKTTKPNPDEASDQSYLNKLAGAMSLSLDNILDPDDKEKSKGDETAAGDEAKKKAEEEAKAKREQEEKEAKEREETERKRKEAEAAAAPVRPIVIKKVEPKVVEDLDKKQADADQKYIDGLTEDQKEEIELARFAESHGKTGLVKQYLDYYRAVDKFAEENPDATPEDEALIKLKERHEPKLSNAERRKLERAMIVESATSKAREEVTREFEPVVKELNEIKAAPTLKLEIEKIESLLSQPVENEVAIESDVVKKVQSLPREQALQAYPIEAPIVLGAISATRELTRIYNKAVDVDPNNPTHKWLLDLIEYESARILGGPKEGQTKGGRQFVSPADYARIQKSKPELAVQYYTLSHADIVAGVARVSRDQFKSKLKQLESAGFVRKKEEKTEKAEHGDPAANSGTPSPKATTHTAGGAVEGEKNKGVFDDMPHLRIVERAMSGTK